MKYKIPTSRVAEGMLSFTGRLSELKKTIYMSGFAKRYAIFSVVVLLGTTMIWAILGSSIQRGNADQLVNTYLFDSSASFDGATLPAAHTFLIKWPLFFLIHLFGSSGFALSLFTVLVTMVTVAFLIIIIRRIEPRHLYFGTICLALASVLLMVPSQPYAGGLLPVNMAMIATRNLEYVLYITSLIVLIRSPRIKSIGFWVAVALLAVLIASDKLFLTLSLGGAFFALIVYGFTGRRLLAKLSTKWLSATLVSAAAAGTILWWLNKVGVVHIANQTGLSPYSLVDGFHNLGIGILYGLLGLLTNFGANPAFDATIVRNIPSRMYERLTDIDGPAFLINVAIFAAGIYMAARLIAYSRRPVDPGNEREPGQPVKLSLLLLWTSLAALLAFVITNHYYAVDARYLTITLFAVFIAATSYIREKMLPPSTLVLTGGVILIGIIFGLAATARAYGADKAALVKINDRNSLVAQALSHHPVDTLIGDYWRVIPTKQISNNHLTVTPLASCTKPRDVLSSQAWQPNLNHHSFAYLLSLDHSLTDYPDCSLEQVINEYGRPNASVLIAGSLSKPQELLLFYDNGIRKSPPTVNPPSPQAPATVLPITLDSLPNTSCQTPSVMNIVAHQDDDLLFINPEIVHDIQAGWCTRTVYITAGDAGADQFYWLSREQGSEAAYQSMDGPEKDIWVKRIVELPDHQFITVANPRGNTKISLIFLHLPDGNLKGQGFSTSQHESLARLETGKISAMHSVDGQSTYSSAQLVEALTALMHAYQPGEIRTQANYISSSFPDHSDHLAVGRYVKHAYQQYEMQQYENRIIIPIKFFIGYPIYGMPANVSGADLQLSQEAFFAYAKFDPKVCKSMISCQTSRASYDSYLARQYQYKE